MIIAAPSVPHTGHHFMWKRVMKDYESVPANMTVKHLDARDLDGDKVVVLDHFHPDKINSWLLFVERYLTIISLRHPARCLLSHEKRSAIPYKTDRVYSQWKNMMRAVSHCKEVLFLHLDDYGIREQQAEIILDRIGSDFEVDWSVNPESGSVAGTHQAEVTDELLSKVNVEFVDFYYSTMEIR